ncbi:MAG: Cys-tRNA(Pro) deacylase [Clostridia bacterium]|nr:Cys-tRNA(Pro) deacylase [Clostridia bacterium]
MKEIKTNAMRTLEKEKIAYKHYEYDPEVTDGVSVAQLMGQDKNRVFKTLVTVSAKGINYVFVVPVGETLDLKKAAKCVGEKSVAMIKQKELLPLTGYVHGGCSPIGMKKLFRTVIHNTAKNYDTICVSAGKKGNQIELSPVSLAKAVNAEFSDIVTDN